MSEQFLLISAMINQNVTNVFIGYLVDILSNGATKLTVAISSPGGNVVNGVTIYNVIKSAPIEIVTHNIGNVDSIANVIFMAGSQRLANSTSTFMFHSVGFEGNSNERLEENNLLEKLDIIKAEHSRIASIISGTSGLEIDECLDLFRVQATRDAQWAVDNGIASGIAEFKIPLGGNIKYLV